jgi:hypothetical protein
LSSTGGFPVEDPVVDFWAEQSMKSKLIGAFLIICHSIVFPDGAKPYIRIQYPPNAISQKDATATFRMILHCLQKIPATATLREAVADLRKFRAQANL